MCSCAQHADKCYSVKRLSQSSANSMADDNYLEIDNPIRYLMKKIGFDRLFRRVQVLSTADPFPILLIIITGTLGDHFFEEFIR